MKTVHEEAQAASQRQAARTLNRASAFAALHASAKPLFQRVMKRPGGSPVLVRVVWPGVVQVCDPQTGDVLAVSEPGRPDQLSEGYVPDLDEGR